MNIDVYRAHFKADAAATGSTTLGGGSSPVIFSHPGTLTPTVSPPYEPEITSSIRRIKAILSTAGDNATTLRFYRNGEAFLDIILEAGETKAVQESMSEQFIGDTDRLDIELISLGDNASNLTVQVYGLL